MDLRPLTGMASRAVDDGSRTIVVDCGRPVGLIVDRVLRVASFGDDRIDPPQTMAAGSGLQNRDLLAGVVKEDDGAGLIQILDARARRRQPDTGGTSGHPCGQSPYNRR